MTTALGQALAAHRAACARCTRQRACGRYLRIVRDHAARRPPLAARHVIPSARQAR